MVLARKLKTGWSPQQISGWLKRIYSVGENFYVSHETIYKTLYIQARGAFKKELVQCFRSQRVKRRSKHSSLKGKGLGKIVDAVSISERPASVEDRATPGHREGDLIAGTNNSYIATLVERHSRYVMLAKIADKKTVTVIAALIKQSKKLPRELYKSLHGTEVVNWLLTRNLPLRQILKITSVIHDHRCNEALMKTLTGYYDSIFQKEQTYSITHK